MTGPATFRIYARRSRQGLFVRVRIFRTKAEMMATLRREAKETGGERQPRDLVANMQSIEVQRLRRERWVRLPQLGLINLYRNRVGLIVVVHEIGHAMFAWARRKRLPGSLAERPEMETEERVLHAQSEMLHQFRIQAVKLGLWN